MQIRPEWQDGIEAALPAVGALTALLIMLAILVG